MSQAVCTHHTLNTSSKKKFCLDQQYSLLYIQFFRTHSYSIFILYSNYHHGTHTSVSLSFFLFHPTPSSFPILSPPLSLFPSPLLSPPPAPLLPTLRRRRRFGGPGPCRRGPASTPSSSHALRHRRTAPGRPPSHAASRRRPAATCRPCTGRIRALEVWPRHLLHRPVARRPWRGGAPPARSGACVRRRPRPARGKGPPVREAMAGAQARRQAPRTSGGPEARSSGSGGEHARGSGRARGGVRATRRSDRGWAARARRPARPERCRRPLLSAPPISRARAAAALGGGARAAAVATAAPLRRLLRRG